MSFTTIYPLNIITPVTITREDYYNVGSTNKTVGSIPRMIVGSSFELWTAKTGGTQLTINVDYELVLSSTHYSDLASTPIYGGFKVINPSYQTGSVFTTYDTIGSLTSSEFYNVMQESGSGLFRNGIINGNMEIAQRGTSFAAIANGGCPVDRFAVHYAGTMVNTASQDTDVPNGLSENSLKIDVTTADAAIATSEYTLIQQIIEGYNLFPFMDKECTLSFWVKSTKTGIFCVSCRSGGNDSSYIKEYTINESDTWEYKTILLSIDDGTTGTWYTDDRAGLRIGWILASGSTFETTPDTWQLGNYFATSNQVNAMDSTANNFLLSQVQMNQGEFALPYQPRHYEEELALCQRYYEKSYDYATAPATATTIGAQRNYMDNVAVASNRLMFVPSFYKVTKRNVPTLLIYSTSGAVGQVLSIGGDIAASTWYIGTNNFTVSGTNSLSTSAGSLQYHWIADAEF